MKYTEATIDQLDKPLQDLVRSIYDKEKKSFNKGLFLTGGTGVGKTYALNAIKNRASTLVGYSSTTGVENWVELLFELKDKFNTGNIRQFLSDDITSRSFVFIDDVGAEKQTEWSQEMLYLIVNRIYEAGRVIFLATNLSLDEFTTKYGDRITSRLVEMCEVKEMQGEDRRLN